MPGFGLFSDVVPILNPGEEYVYSDRYADVYREDVVESIVEKEIHDLGRGVEWVVVWESGYEEPYQWVVQSLHEGLLTRKR